MTAISLSQLESHLWESANILRGPVDAADFKSYVFPLMFFKRISDVHDEEHAAALIEFGGDEESALFLENYSFQIVSYINTGTYAQPVLFGLVPKYTITAEFEGNMAAADEAQHQIDESKQHAAEFQAMLKKAEKRFAALAKVEKRHAEAYQNKLDELNQVEAR